MPKALERELKARASGKFPGKKKRQDAYVYGTLRNTGWRPIRERSKGRKKRG